MRVSRAGARSGAAVTLLAASLVTACTSPLSAPADASLTAPPRTSGASQSRQVLPVAPSATPVRAVALPTPTPAPGEPLPAPLAPVVTPIVPAIPTLTLAPRPPLDAASQAALDAISATATAQVAAAQATAQALPPQEIVIRDLGFAPSTLTVKPGTTIVWRNQDRVQHQVAGGEFDSGRIPGGGQWAQVIGKPGLYQFLCSFHPTMRAEITVSPDDTRPIQLGS